MKPVYDYRLWAILNMIKLVQYGPRTFTELQNESTFKFKSSFLKYLTYCQSMGFIKKTDRDGKYQPYKITPKGSDLLEMFRPSYTAVIPLIL